MRKHHPLLRLNPYRASIKPAQTSPIPASESLSWMHQTCTNLSPSCVWILIMHASNLHKPPPLLRLNPSHTRIKPAQTPATPASESFSCLHQTCTNLTHSCAWIFLIHASNSPKPHKLLRLNPSHTSIKPAQTSPTRASESFSYTHQTCTNLTHSCVWILLTQASNVHKPHPLLRLNPSFKSIKPAQTSPTLSCVWILRTKASNLRKPHRFLRLNHSHACIKHAKHHPLPCLNPSHTRFNSAQTSSTRASESFS